MRVHTSRQSVGRLRYDAMAEGSPVGMYAGSCTDPREIFAVGRPDEFLVRFCGQREASLAHTMYVRCRKCPDCLAHRARLWTARGIDETKLSARTWFGTLTLAPDRQTWARYSAHANLQRGGWGPEEFGDGELFRKSIEVINPEITRFLKRVRKVNPFRYMLVTEQHKSGLPHFHCLIHEYAGTLTKRVLEDKWRYGHSHFRLIPEGNEQMVGYVAKYLAKSLLTRVRASEDYGQGSKALITERINAATRALANAREAVVRPDPQYSLLKEGSPEPVMD